MYFFNRCSNQTININLIKKLDLSIQNLQLINETNLFEYFQALNVLDLNLNNLSYFTSDIFKAKNNLKHLNLESNNITLIETEMFKNLNYANKYIIKIK
jgi:Leucine-rich repeat (LRR) protein